MNALQFIYEETEIHFLVNPERKDVMVNATEMAKAFGKRTDKYLQNDSTKELIAALKVPQKWGTLSLNVYENRGRNGMYFCEILAIDFATWLDVEFKIWVYQRIQESIFGNYRLHWEAHTRQEAAKKTMEILKEKLLTRGTPELALAYFEAEKNLNEAKHEKSRAIRNQLNLFEQEQ